MALSNKTFYDIVVRPSLLHMVATLWEKEKLLSQARSLTSAYVIQLFVKLIYERQAQKERSSPSFMFLNDSERAFFMNGIATYMASNKLPNQISRERLNIVTDDLLEAIPDSVSTSASVFMGQQRRPLKQRVQDTANGLDFIRTNVRTYCLLSEDGAAPGTYKFGHKSFMEYLFAETIFHYLRSGHEQERAEAIINAFDLRIEDILEMQVSTDFFAEMLKTNHGFNSNSQSLDDAKRFCEQVFLAVHYQRSPNNRFTLFADTLWQAFRISGQKRTMRRQYIIYILIYLLIVSSICGLSSVFGSTFSCFALILLLIPMTPIFMIYMIANNQWC